MDDIDKIIQNLKQQSYDEVLRDVAALALARQQIKTVTDLEVLLKPYAYKQQEYFLAILLNERHQIIKIEECTVNLHNKFSVTPMEVFRPAIVQGAYDIIIAHNHPSGDAHPSKGDLNVSQALVNAGSILGIPILDHLIIVPSQIYSLLSNNEFPSPQV